MTDAVVRRTAATQATLNAWADRPMRIGTADCVRLIASHLRRLGYKVKLPPSGSYRTYASAVKALRKAGHDTVEAALDGMGLERIAPAAAIVGDIVMLPADHPLGCFTVALGNGRVLGWHQDAPGATVLQPVEYAGAWRTCPPRQRPIGG